MPPPYQSWLHCNKQYESLSKKREEEGNGDEDDYKCTVRANSGHALYFNYKELRPLLLPLILGQDETTSSISQNEKDGNNNDDDKDNKWDGWRKMSNKEGSYGR